MRITKRVAPCATRCRPATTLVRLLGAGPLRGAAHRHHRGQGARARAARRDGHGDGLAGQGARGDPRPRRAAHRRTGYIAVPHLAARMVTGRGRARRRSATGSTGKGITRVFVPGGDADPAGDYPDALVAARGPRRRSGRPFAHVGITGYPESHPTIHDDLTVQSMWDKRRYATHVVSNLTFDPALIQRLGAPDARPRHHHAAAARHARARSTATKLLAHGHQDRRRRVDAGSWPSTRARSPGSRRPAASPASGSSRSAPRPSATPECAGRGPARLHLQPDRRDRGLAPRPARAAVGATDG